MSGVAIEMQFRGIEEAERAIAALTGFERVELMETIGRTVQLQTRRRISTEKESPEGEAWKPNRKGSDILKNTGRLHESIDYIAQGDQVEIGTPLIYARIHQDGGTIVPKNSKALAFAVGNATVFAKSVTIPARPYIGLSSDNESELDDVVRDFLGELLQ